MTGPTAAVGPAAAAAISAARRGEVRVLHTSDWHVGKTIRGVSRLGEHQAVLAEIAALADTADADLVIVAGDLFDTAAPPAAAEQAVYDALRNLASDRRGVAVIAGNHDHPERLVAVAPLFKTSGVTVVARPAAPDAGGAVTFTTAAGADAVVALCPFVPQRRIVRAEHLIAGNVADNTGRYKERMRAILAALCEPFRADAANIVAAHAFFVGAGRDGAGERAAHFIDEYALSADALPAAASYAALGHVHRPQKIPAAAPAHYCGSPLALDFGEVPHPKQVNLVDIDIGLPARVTALELTSGRALRTVEGTLDALEAVAAADDSDDWLRVRVKGDAAVGLAANVRDLFGDRAVDVRCVAARRARTRRRVTGSPRDVFGEYLQAAGAHDERLLALFDRLHNEDPPDPDTGSGRLPI